MIIMVPPSLFYVRSAVLNTSAIFLVWHVFESLVGQWLFSADMTLVKHVNGQNETPRVLPNQDRARPGLTHPWKEAWVSVPALPLLGREPWHATQPPHGVLSSLASARGKFHLVTSSSS